MRKDNKIFYNAIKRITDIIGALLALIIFSPIMLIIAILIKLDSKGPAIFVQDRIGKDGKAFRFYKFRTMRTDTDPYGFSPKEFDDPRITRLGKFLRKYSLDELPQLFNVLKGDMSLVGPRPLLPWQYEKWTEYQRQRCNVKPGLTGWAQVKGRASLTHEDKIELDIWYVKNANFWLDIKIILMTLIKVLKTEDILEKQYSKSENENDAEIPKHNEMQ